MRFVSRYGRLTIELRPMIQEAYATGMAKVIQTPIYARFQPEILSLRLGFESSRSKRSKR